MARGPEHGLLLFRKIFSLLASSDSSLSAALKPPPQFAAVLTSPPATGHHRRLPLFGPPLDLGLARSVDPSGLDRFSSFHLLMVTEGRDRNMSDSPRDI
ncbi:unnamed protein product [Urochloa humidicola]